MTSPKSRNCQQFSRYRPRENIVCNVPTKKVTVCELPKTGISPCNLTKLLLIPPKLKFAKENKRVHHEGCKKVTDPVGEEPARHQENQKACCPASACIS